MGRSVFLYVPNIIGYCRVGCTLASLALAGSSPVLFLCFYFLAFAADAVDGWAARKLGQTSKLGAVLDMVTDRCSTVGLLAILGRLAPDRSFLWIFLMLLDISSHWFQVYASAVRGEESHKDSKSTSFIVRLYYSNRMFMGFCCVSAEALAVHTCSQMQQLLQYFFSAFLDALSSSVSVFTSLLLLRRT